MRRFTRRATVMFQISAAEVLKPSWYVVEWVMDRKKLRVGPVPIKLVEEEKTVRVEMSIDILLPHQVINCVFRSRPNPPLGAFISGDGVIALGSRRRGTIGSLGLNSRLCKT